MFRSALVPVILSKATLVRGQDEDGNATIEADCQLVLEPFREELARELGEGIADHLFIEQPAGYPSKVRPELQTITLDPKVPKQAVSVSSTPDGSHMSGTWRDVAFGALTVSRVEKNSLVWLKAVQRINFSIAPKEHRELLIAKFGEILYLNFECEQGDVLGTLAERVAAAVDGITITAGDTTATMHARAGR